MTIYDHNLPMAEDKRVGVAQLKAHLSEHLRAVEDGETLIVLNHNRPVARIVPYEEVPLWQRRGRPPLIAGHAGKSWMEDYDDVPPADAETRRIVQEALAHDRKR